MKERDHWEDVGIDVKIILGGILGQQDRKVEDGCIWLRTG
jgi:hypothetical protein